MSTRDESANLTTIVRNTGSGSWLVDMILWFDRKTQATSQQCQWFRPPRYDSSKPRAEVIETYLYLAYGSNLCASVFQGNRQITPISSINVIVPELRLTWNVPGIPFAEPCYANAQRQAEVGVKAAVSGDDKTSMSRAIWNQGLVGVVYEISAADYAHILKTEGQGYQATEVECFPLEPEGDTLVTGGGTPPFTANVVLIPEMSNDCQQHMQPSQRYLNLLITGAKEHGLPSEYIDFLQSLPTYNISTPARLAGKSLFSFFWFVPMFTIICLERTMADRDGRVPSWVNRLVDRCFSGMWWTHRYCFKPVFGDGASS